jgi:hypothetical protein
MKHDCDWYIQVMGLNPQTGAEMNQWGCSIAFMPMLLIEGSQQTRQTGAAIESFRNEMVKSNNELLAAGELQKRLNGE